MSKFTLALFGVLAMVATIPLVLAALSDPALATKLVPGALPPGTDLSGDRIAAVAVFASRMILPIVRVLAACVPFTPMSLFALLLAF